MIRNNEWDFPTANYCRHFKGALVDETCPRGVRFADVTKVEKYGRTGFALRLPCFHDTTGSEFTCDCLDRLTNEEVEREQQKINDHIADFLPKMLKAREAIIADVTARGALRTKVPGQKRRRGHDVEASIPCPVCGTGTLHYSYCGSYNGHVHARCSTAGCMYWGE